jgi:adenine-specific DNA methylase
MTASWPVHTEMRTRFNAQETAALASSIYIVCRKRTREGTASFSEVQEEIRQNLEKRLSEFWQQGIRGADFFMSAIGPAVEVFGKYAKVLKLSGEPVSVRELLDFARKVTAEFAVRRILEDGNLGTVGPDTRFYLLWRWSYGRAKLDFDEAKKLAQTSGVDLEDLANRGLAQKQKSVVHLLGPQERKHWPEILATMIDVLQRACILWKMGKENELDGLLTRTNGYGEAFWQVAQAIAETLPDGDEERKLLHGLLGRSRKIKAEGPDFFSGRS